MNVHTINFIQFNSKTKKAPPIRVIDEHGHEVRDRYYKVGSVIDLTCQVSASFLSHLPTRISGNHPYLKFKARLNERTTTSMPSLILPSSSLLSSSSPITTATVNETSINYYFKQLRWFRNNETLLNKNVNLNLR